MKPGNRRSKNWVLGALLAALLPAQAWADERVEASRHFSAGMDHIAAGEFEAGIVELEEAYRISPHPFVLFNIGRAYFEIGELALAEENIQAYLAEDPPDREQVEAFLLQIEAAKAKAEVGGAEIQATPAPTVQAPVAESADIQALAGQMYEMMAKLEAILAQGGTLPAGGVAKPATVGENPQIDGSADGPGDGPGDGATAPETDPSVGDSPSTNGGSDEAPAADRDGGIDPDATAADGSAAVDGASAGEGTPTPQAPAIVPELDPYQRQVVTASRSVQNPLDAPNAITVITSEDIRQSAARTIPDILRRVPGIDVMANGPGDFNIGIRGFNSTLANKVLVLVDGRSVYLDFIGATLWPMLSISPSDIERIEVIRGPGAALYGAGAFSGVINIITKTPGAADDGNSVTVQTGLPDWVDGNIHLTGRNGKTGYRASVGFEQVERWSIDIDETREDYEIYAEKTDHATAINRFDGRLDQRLGEDTALSLSGGIASGQVEFTAIGALRDFVIDGNSGYLRGDLKLPKGITARMFWNYFDVYTSPWASPTGALGMQGHQTSNIIDTELEASETFHFGVEHQVNVGVGHRFKSINWDYLLGERTEHHLKFFIQDQMALRDDLTGYLSLRVDRHPLLAQRTGDDLTFFDTLPTSPRAAVVWRFKENQSLRATVGTAFRNPSFLESYLNLPIPTSNQALAVLSAGNEGLGPERIFSAEIGYLNIPADDRFEVQGALYANRVTDLIVLGDVNAEHEITGTYDPQLGVWYAGATAHENQSESYMAVGGEIALRLYPVDGVDVYANYAYEYVQQSDGTVVGSTSPSKFNGGVQYRAESGLEVGVDLHYVDTQLWNQRSFNAAGQAVLTPYQVPAYAWVGARLGYRVDDRLELAVQGTNLLDLLRAEAEGGGVQVATPANRHREYPTGQLVPVGLAGSLTYRF